MKKGVSINIGVNNIDADSYKLASLGSFSNLVTANSDAQRLFSFAKKQQPKFEAVHPEGNPFAPLFVGKPTADKLIEKIKSQAAYLKPEDLLLITFCGHGMIVPFDENRDSIEGQIIPKDVAWCLNDRPLLDVELTAALALFKKGVRILIISDSCHSGTIIDWIKLGIDQDLSEKLESEKFNKNLFEKAVLNAKGYNFVKLNKEESKINSDILKRTDIKTIRENNLLDFKRRNYINQYRDFLVEMFQENSFSKPEIDSVLKKYEGLSLNKKLYFSLTNNKLKNLINKDIGILNKLPLFDSKTLINEKINLDDLRTIPLLENPQTIPTAFVEEIYRENGTLYKDRRNKAMAEINSLSREIGRTQLINASVIVLSACQDNQTTLGGCLPGESSDYISAIFQTLKDAEYNQNYAKFQDGIEKIFKTTNRISCDGKSFHRFQTPKVTRFNENQGMFPFITNKPFQI